MRAVLVLSVVLLACAPHRIVLEQGISGGPLLSRLELTANGEATFESKAFGASPGAHRSTFDRRRFAELERELERMRFTEFKVKCKGQVVDTGSVRLSWIRGSERTTVTDDGCWGMERKTAISRFSRAVDVVGDTARWFNRARPRPPDHGDALVYYNRWSDEEFFEVLVCRDGRAGVTDSRMGMVGRLGLQFRLSADQVAHIAEVLPAEDEAKLFSDREELIWLQTARLVKRSERVEILELLREWWQQSPEVRLEVRPRGRRWTQDSFEYPWPDPNGVPATMGSRQLADLLSSMKPPAGWKGQVLLERDELVVLAGVDAPLIRASSCTDSAPASTSPPPPSSR